VGRRLSGGIAGLLATPNRSTLPGGISQRPLRHTESGMNVKRAAKHLAWALAPSLYRRMLPRDAQQFSIGIVIGDSPFTMQSRTRADPVLTHEDVTDVPATLVADPFMCHHGDQWYLFFEVVNHLTRKGEVGLAVSRDALEWRYERIVLAESFHLSYPHVFEWEGAHYMIPEGSRGGGVHLYRAAAFPYGWTRVGTLLEGPRFADSSILLHRKTWWLFTDAGAEPANPVLRLYFADKPTGPWREHPSSPIRADRHFTRPGGRVVAVDGTPVRFAQDIYPLYGSSVSAFAVTKLTPTEYQEERVGDGPVLGAGSSAWNRHGMHHIDAHRRADGSWIACVDGLGSAPERAPATNSRSSVRR